MSYIKHILVIALLICGTFLGYGFVSGGNIFFDTEISSEEALSKYVFLDSDTLNSTIISYTSNRSLEAYTLHSSCNTRSRYLSENGGVYYFKIEYVDDLCTNPYVYLSYQGGILSNTQLTLSLIRQGELVDYFGDFPEEELVKVSTVYNRMITSLQLFKTIDTSLVTDDAYGYLEKHRKYHEYVYRDQVLRSVLTGRQEAYISPVPGYQISEKTNKIPNAGRPYRNSYTDGIHHGWDIDAPKGTSVVALADGVIVRVVENFHFSDLSKIKEGENLTEDEKLRNLDLLRGKQVWLKTLKGDVVFYSHLDSVYADIQEGTVVKSGHPLGTIGATGVPDTNYTDFHLHFAIQKNPYNRKMAGKYDIVDYMKWDWYFRGEDAQSVLSGQKALFQ